MSSGTNEDDPKGTHDEIDENDPVVQKIVEEMAALDEQERTIRTESATSLRDWIVQTYNLSLVRAQRVALIVQQALINLGLS